MPFENFPYTNFHELNLNWVLSKVKEMYEYVQNIGDVIDTKVVELFNEALASGRITGRLSETYNASTRELVLGVQIITEE